MLEKNNKLVEEAFLQMKQVEDAIAENAKGILQSTMKEEISQLVKESLSEQGEEEDGVETDVNMDSEEEDYDDSDEMNTDNEDEEDFELDPESEEELNFNSDSEEESPIDLTGVSDDEFFKVFKVMGKDDGIIVKKDGNDIYLSDDDDEYLIKLGESEEDTYEIYDEMDEMDKMSTHDIVGKLFGRDSSSSFSEVDEDEPIYEIQFDEEEDDPDNIMEYDDLEEEDDFNDIMEYDDLEEEDDFDDIMEYDDLDEEDEPDDLEESYDPKKVKKGEHKEGKMSIKPKGVGIGNGPKIKKVTSNTVGGFKEEVPEAFKGKVKAVGTGSAKKDVFKKGENMEGKPKVVKKIETKEAARTKGMGSKFREGGLPKPRTGSSFNINAKVQKESLEKEIIMLRQKNEEYRKALNVFREKLTEVAIFNSNLAYATRLFTEHSTTKKEKINILRRFDGVASLKESKQLYRSIKDHLSNPEAKPINETVERNINKTASSGSSVSLIESKTYENPQFLRMKDLMGKLG